MTEQELVDAFASIVRSEKRRIQKIALTHTGHDLYDKAYETRFIFNKIHKRGSELVDQWIREARGH